MGTPCGAVASSCRRGSSQVRPRPSPWPRSWALLPPPVPRLEGEREETPGRGLGFRKGFCRCQTTVFN